MDTGDDPRRSQSPRARPNETQPIETPPSASRPNEPPAPEDLPILRRSRAIWATLAILLGILLVCCPLPLPLPDKPISNQLPLLTWRQLGWAGVGGFLILCCLIRYLREKFVNSVADQLTDLVLLVTGALLDLAAHWRQHSSRWGVGLALSAFLVFPVGVWTSGRFFSQLERAENLSEFRGRLLRFVCYGRLQGGNEADLRALTETYGLGDSPLPEGLSTPSLRTTYSTVKDLYELQKDALNDDFEIRRRRILDFWKNFADEPLAGPPEEPAEVEDFVALLALRARARSLLLFQDGVFADPASALNAAEEEYRRLQDLASRVHDRQDRRRFLGVALNGLGTVELHRYRLILAETGAAKERARADFLNQAYSLYQKSCDRKSGGDEGDDARIRRENNEADLELHLIKEVLVGSDAFREALDSRLLTKYISFRDDPASVMRWVKDHASIHEEKARFARNPLFFLTVAQINALAAEKLMQDDRRCEQDLLNPVRSPGCVKLEQTLRNGFMNLSTAIYLGEPAQGIAREPKKNFVCVYFSNPVTARDAEFLFARFKATLDSKRCT